MGLNLKEPAIFLWPRALSPAPRLEALSCNSPRSHSLLCGDLQIAISIKIKGLCKKSEPIAKKPLRSPVSQTIKRLLRDVPIV